jgi:hypothetical protein
MPKKCRYEAVENFSCFSRYCSLNVSRKNVIYTYAVAYRILSSWLSGNFQVLDLHTHWRCDKPCAIICKSGYTERLLMEVKTRG